MNCFSCGGNAVSFSSSVLNSVTSNVTCAIVGFLDIILACLIVAFNSLVVTTSFLIVLLARCEMSHHN